MEKTGKILISGVLLAVLLTGTGIYSLSFEDITSGLNSTFEVRSASLQRECLQRSAVGKLSGRYTDNCYSGSKSRIQYT